MFEMNENMYLGGLEICIILMNNKQGFETILTPLYQKDVLSLIVYVCNTIKQGLFHSYTLSSFMVGQQCVLVKGEKN